MERVLDQTATTYPETYVREMTGADLKLILLTRAVVVVFRLRALIATCGAEYRSRFGMLPDSRAAPIRRSRHPQGSTMAGSSSSVPISTSGPSGSRSRGWPRRLHHATRNPNVAAAAASHPFDD